MLWKHCREYHNESDDQEDMDDQDDNDLSEDGDSDAQDEDEATERDDHDSMDENQDITEQLNIASLKFLIAVKRCKINKIEANNIMAEANSLTETLRDVFKKVIDACLQKRNCDQSSIQECRDKLNEIVNPFVGLQTTYLQEKVLQSSLPYVEPKTVILGSTVIETDYR